MELLLLYLLIGGAAYAAIAYSSSSSTPSYGSGSNSGSGAGSSTGPIGGDKDAHGCLVGAGYSWDEAQGKCVRLWEVNNSSAATLPSYVHIVNWQGTDVQGFDSMAFGSSLDGALSYYSDVKVTGTPTEGKVALTASKLSAPISDSAPEDTLKASLMYAIESAGASMPSPHFVLFVKDLQAIFDAETQKSPSLLPTSITVFVVDDATVPKLATKGSDLAVRLTPEDPIAYK